MNLLQNLNDEQIALVGCAAALFMSGTLMSLSYYIGRARGLGSGLAGRQFVPEAARVSTTGNYARERQKAA